MKILQRSFLIPSVRRGHENCATPGSVRPLGLGWLSAAVLAVAGCALPERPSASALYDLGPAATAIATATPSALPALALSLQATPALEGSAMRYRLAYADAQQVRAYTQSRWASPPADLVLQRLREGLSTRNAVLKPGEGAPWSLQLELDEFAQVFDSERGSVGRLRLRATLSQATATGTRLVAQRSVLVQQPASSADASGGVRALALATDDAVQELVQWLALWR